MTPLQLYRSKQSEDVAALSIVGNKNSETIENFFNTTLEERLKTIEKNISDLQKTIINKFDYLKIDLSILTDPQSLGNFSAVVSSLVEADKTTFQVYVTYLGQDYDFNEKVFMGIQKELVVKANFTKVNSASVILNFPIKTEDLNDKFFNLYIHS